MQLSSQPGVLIKNVADSLDIHPFMLSRWRKEFRDGKLKGAAPDLPPDQIAELQRLKEEERQFKRLQMEHDLLNLSIRFASELRARNSPSSKQTGKPTRSK